MRTSKATYVVSIAAVALCGCAVPFDNVRIPLQDPAVAAVDLSRVDLEDARPPEARGNQSADFVGSERWYGDATFVPDKLTYLKLLLAARIPPAGNARVRLTAFDTIENCAAADMQATTSSVGTVTGIYMNPGSGPNSGRMQVQLEGEINGKPFSVNRWFSHADLDRNEAAHKNRMYQDRLSALLARCADEIIAIGFR